MEPGSLIREIRQSKNMTLQDLADNIVSFSTLASFERNKTMLNFTSVIHLLQKLNVTPGEFIAELDFDPCNHLLLFEKIQKFVAAKDDSSYRNLLKNLAKQANESVDFQKKLDLIMAKSIGQQFFNFPGPTHSEIEFFQEYLFSIQRTTHYDLTLFGNCYFYFPDSFILSVCKKILTQIKRTETSANFRDNLRVISNCVLYFLEQNKLTLAKQLLTSTFDVTPQSYVYERFYLTILELIYQKKQGSLTKEIQEEAQQILKTLQLLDCAELGDIAQELFYEFSILN